MAVLRGVKGHLALPLPLLPRRPPSGSPGTARPSPTPTGREVLWSIPEGITHQSVEGSGVIPMLTAITTILTEFHGSIRSNEFQGITRVAAEDIVSDAPETNESI